MDIYLSNYQSNLSIHSIYQSNLSIYLSIHLSLNPIYPRLGVVKLRVLPAHHEGRRLGAGHGGDGGEPRVEDALGHLAGQGHEALIDIFRSEFCQEPNSEAGS